MKNNKAANRKNPTKERYNNFPKKCKNCNLPISYQYRRHNSFCSIKCANYYNSINRINRIITDEFRLKMRNIRLHQIQEMGPKIRKTELYVCEVCNSTFKYHKKRKTCSKACLSSLVSTEVRSNPRKTLRSKDEISLFLLCEEHFKLALHNTIIEDGWDADIVLSDHKIAILWNGPWHYREMPGLKHSLLQVQTRDRIKTILFKKLGWTVLVYEDRYYTPQSAFKEIKLVAQEKIEFSRLPYERNLCTSS